MSKTIFDFINGALFTKTSSLENVDDEMSFSMFMLNRWCSMYSPDMAIIVNDTSNRYYRSFDTKADQLAFCTAIFPRVKFKKIAYIKKAKAEKQSKEADTSIEHYAKSHEISTREAKLLLKAVEDLTSLTKI